MLLTSTKHGFDKETLKNDKKGGKEKRRCFLYPECLALEYQKMQLSRFALFGRIIKTFTKLL